MSESCETVFNTYEFLEEYQKYPCLWLKVSTDFKNRNKRDAAEKALLEVSGLESIKALRNKIRSIRGTYNGERAKVRKSITTGSGRDDVYKPKLVWYNFADSFLRRNEPENETQSNLETAEHETIETVENDFFETPSSTPSSNTVPQSVDDEPETPITAVRKKKRVVSQKPNLENSLDNAVEVLKHISKSHQSNNEFTHFGLHVASQLQALPLREALQLQTDIQSLITTVRVKQLSEPSPSFTELSYRSTNESMVRAKQLSESSPTFTELISCSSTNESMVRAKQLSESSPTFTEHSSSSTNESTVQNPAYTDVLTYYTNWTDNVM